MRVNIWTDNGPVKAVFGYPAIHVREIEKDQAPKVKDIFLDCGATTKAQVLEMGINVGNVATFDDGLIELGTDYLTGRALDNRIGGYMIAEVLRKLKEGGHTLPFGLYIINSVQEEIGLRGAEMIANRIKPNVAIITDVTHDTYSPMYKKLEQGDQKCGSGPVLTFGPAVQNNLLKLIFTAAQENNIAVQRAVASRFTGTDTDAFAYSSGGIASALISLPLKYMHTTVETVHKGDVQAVIDLIFNSVLKIENGQDFRYIK
jgi:putative aminopeptidase FrvX